MPEDPGGGKRGSDSHRDQTPNNVPSSGEGRRGRRNNRNRRRTPSGTRFTGACEELKDYVYDMSSSRNNAEMFTRTTKAIGEHIAREYNGGGEFRNGLPTMTLPTLVAPALPADSASAVQVKLWELDIKDHRKKAEDRERNMEKAYALILGQCSKTVRDRLEAHDDWVTVNQSSNTLGLLRLIRQSLYQQATRCKDTHALIEAETALMRFRQSERMSNSDYLEKLRDLVEVDEHLGGEPGMSSARIDARVMDLEDLEEREAAKIDACEEYIAVLLLTKSDPKRYVSLVANIENQLTRGQDVYPTTVSGAYDLLVNYRNPNQAMQMQTQDTGVAFAQSESYDAENDNEQDQTRNAGSTEGGRGGRGWYSNQDSGRGRGCGSRGGRGTYGQGQAHAIDTNEEHKHEGNRDENNNLDQSPNPYSPHVRIDHIETVFMQALWKLPGLWLLIDSCSSTNLICDKCLLHGIFKAECPMTIHCNAGTVRITHKGYYRTYPEPVWYNPKGITNIMSLDNITKYYRITMDSRIDKAMILHKTDGSMVCITPTSKGLYHCKIDSNVENMWSLVTTVADKANKYTQRTIRWAQDARRFQNIIMRPGSRELMDVAVTHLRGCSITRGDVIAAEDIFGPNLEALKGKTVSRPGQHVRMGIDPVPHEILKTHRSIALAINIMFVNSVAFLLTTSRNLKFGTVEALENRQVTTIVRKLKTIEWLYHQRGFRIVSMLADPEFEPIRPEFPYLNCCAMNEHVPDIERYVRTVKDRVHSTYRMLPFKRVPRVMLIHLI